MRELRYAEIKRRDIANGSGVRVSLFVQGCFKHCKGCFNESTWDFNGGKPFTRQVADQLIEDLKPAYVRGLSILGGEPFEFENQRGLVSLFKHIKETYPDKTIWCYTGFKYEDLFSTAAKMHKKIVRTNTVVGTFNIDDLLSISKDLVQL